jgi:hypothetical protein
MDLSEVGAGHRAAGGSGSVTQGAFPPRRLTVRTQICLPTADRSSTRILEAGE